MDLTEPTVPRLMTTAEVVERTRLSLASVYQHCSRQNLRAYKVGKRLLFSPEDVLQFLSLRVRQPRVRQK